MTVEEIHFNHDPASMIADAMTIKYADGTVIAAPEWGGGRKHAAAYRAMTLKRPITIKARFSGGPPNGTRRIVAVPVFNHPLTGVPDLGHMADGGMMPKDVSFDAAGDSSLEEFDIKPISGDVAVGTHHLVWSWRFFKQGVWTEFKQTHHTIYVVLASPTAPWFQGAVEPAGRSYPWVEAIQFACQWADGALTVDRATELITNAINTLENQDYPLPDTDNRLFVDEFDAPFNLTFFLNGLNSASFINECTGVTAAVATFGNLLGDRLCPLQMFKDSGTIRTQLIRLIGSNETDDPVQKDFGKHEAATRAGLPLDEHLPVYDACLRFADGVSPDLPVAMPLSRLDLIGGYLPRLIQTGGFENFVLMPPRGVY